MNLLSNTVYDVAIIGAGIAGSYCANALQKAGYRVCLIEKGRGTGGRASSRRLPLQEEGVQQSCDLGAPFFYAKAGQLVDDIQQWLADDVIAAWPAANLAHKGLAYTGIPSMSALTRYLAQYCDLYTQQRISHIDRTDNIWFLRNDSYKTLIKAKRVVITAPAAQTAHLLTSPDAPTAWLQQAHIASRQCSPQWAAVVTEDAEGADGIEGVEVSESMLSNMPDMLEVDHPVLAKIIHDTAKPGRSNKSAGSNKASRWVLQANLEWSELHKDSNADEIGVLMLATFKQLLLERAGASYELVQPELIIATPHLWRLGRHQSSFDASGKVEEQQAGMLWEPSNGLAVSADWLGSGTVVAAMLSAQQLSQAMIDGDC
jgi:renalase